MNASLWVLTEYGLDFMQMTKRVVLEWYKGLAMGMVWSLLNPVFILAVTK
jgi:hypothetical protein